VTQVRESEVLSTLSNVEQEVSADLRSDVGTAGGVDVSHLESEIRESLDIAKTLRRRWDDIENRTESGGILGRVLGSSGDGTIDSDRYRTPYQQLTEHAIFSAPRPPNQKSTVDRTEFSLEVTRDLAEELNNQVEQLKSDIRSELKTAYENLLERVSEDAGDSRNGIAGTTTSAASTELQTEFNRVLEQTPPASLKTEISTLITETVEEQIDTAVDQYVQELEQLKAEIEALDSKYNRLVAAHEVYEQITGQAEDPLRALNEEFQDGFSDEIFDLPNQRATRHAIENLYRHQVTPADLSSAVKCPSLAETSLLEPQPNSEVSQERQDIRKSFKRITSNRVLDNKYNGLERERLRTADVPTFDGTGVYVAYASEAIDTSSTGGAKLNPNDFEEIQQSLERNFHLDEPANQYDEWFVQNGDPWEVSMCVYVQGISFLDNLRDVIAMDGYWSKYQNLTKQQDETRTIERHAYGLEDGFYTVRSDLVDINADTEFYVEQSPDEIRSALLDKQKQVSLDGEKTNVDLEDATIGGDQ
jgi:F0F1-type ATP synthase membrane subunit b/b'